MVFRGDYMDFQKLNLKNKYKSVKDDVLSDFYLPVLGIAKEYKRAVGYFSSNILLQYIDSIE